MRTKICDIPCNCTPPTSSYQEPHYLLVSVFDDSLFGMNALWLQLGARHFFFTMPRLLRLCRIPTIHIALFPVSPLRKQQTARRREIAKCARDRAHADAAKAVASVPSYCAFHAAKPAGDPVTAPAALPDQSQNPHADICPTEAGRCPKSKDAARNLNDAPTNAESPQHSANP